MNKNPFGLMLTMFLCMLGAFVLLNKCNGGGGGPPAYVRPY